MDFAARLAPIGRIFPGFSPTQRCCAGFAVSRLPFPADSALLGIELDQDFEQLVKDTRFFPGLKAFMQNTARNVEPILLDGFPLAAGPQSEEHTSELQSRLHLV